MWIWRWVLKQPQGWSSQTIDQNEIKEWPPYLWGSPWEGQREDGTVKVPRVGQVRLINSILVECDSLLNVTRVLPGNTRKGVNRECRRDTPSIITVIIEVKRLFFWFRVSPITWTDSSVSPLPYLRPTLTSVRPRSQEQFMTSRWQEKISLWRSDTDGRELGHPRPWGGYRRLDSQPSRDPDNGWTETSSEKGDVDMTRGGSRKRWRRVRRRRTSPGRSSDDCRRQRRWRGPLPRRENDDLPRLRGRDTSISETRGLNYRVESCQIPGESLGTRKSKCLRGIFLDLVQGFLVSTNSITRETS